MTIFSHWTLVFVLVIHIGLLLVFLGNKKGAKGSVIQWGYLLFVAGCFGFLSTLTDFTVSMLCLVLATGVCKVIDCFAFKKVVFQKYLLMKHFVHYSGDFFYILLLVFVLRAFLVEPFQIPSSSMRPNLVPGDFILVNKFTYGIRLPILNYIICPFHSVQRGDVVVFNAPGNKKVDFIKRVIGLPGDTIIYQNKKLLINGQIINKTQEGYYIYPTDDAGQLHYNQRFIEQINHKIFRTLNDPRRLPVYLEGVQNHRFVQHCHYVPNGESFTCKVPSGYYFMMGDNRDASNDSRYWGFVPKDGIVGKAFIIWFNFKAFNRIGMTIQ